MPTVTQRISQLPNIFPALGPLTSTVLFLDFQEAPPRTTESQWRTESPILIGHGLAGMALRMMRHDSIEAPADIVRDLENAHFDAVTSTFRMLQSTGPVLERMRSRGIPFLVSKGPGIARAYEPASERTFSDLDILVRPRDFSSALQLLEQAGYGERQETSQPWPSHRRLGREATNLRTIDGGSLDLHHRISPWNWSTGLSFDALAARARDVVIGGVTLPLISIEHNLLIAALHVVSDQSQPGRSYRIWRDLLVLSRISMPNLAAKLAADSDMSGWLEWILMCLPSEVRPMDVLSEMALQPKTIRHRIRLQLLLHTKRDHLLNMMYRIPMSNALFTIGGSLVPSPKYLKKEYPDSCHGYLTRWYNLLSRRPTPFGGSTASGELSQPMIPGGEHRS